MLPERHSGLTLGSLDEHRGHAEQGSSAPPCPPTGPKQADRRGGGGRRLARARRRLGRSDSEAHAGRDTGGPPFPPVRQTPQRGRGGSGKSPPPKTPGILSPPSRAPKRAL